MDGKNATTKQRQSGIATGIAPRGYLPPAPCIASYRGSVLEAVCPDNEVTVPIDEQDHECQVEKETRSHRQ